MQYNLAKDIRYAQTVLKINDAELSTFFKVSGMTINRWKNGKVVPEYGTLEKIYNKIYKAGIKLNRFKEEMYNS